MNSEKILSIGWDAGGMVGKSNALAIFEYTPEDGWEFRNAKKFSPQERLEDGIRTGLEDFLNTFNCYDSQDDGDYRKVIAIDSPFSFPDKFKKWFHGESFTEEDLWDVRERENDLAKFYDSVGYRPTDVYIEKAFSSKFDYSRTLSPVYDKITNQVIMVNSLLKQWESNEDCVVFPADHEPDEVPVSFIEVYPKLIKAEGKSDAPIKHDVSFLNDLESEPGSHCYDAALSALFGIEFATGKGLDEFGSLKHPEDVDKSDLDYWKRDDNELDWIYHFGNEGS